MGFIIYGIIIIVAVLILYYTNNNMHKDDWTMKKVWKAGYKEKQVALPNGTILNYGEGGSINHKSLLLIHGQGQTWKDYDRVLPELAENSMYMQ